MKPDARVFLRLRATDEGGRRTPIGVGTFHGTMMFDETRGYDFRADIAEVMLPGSARELGVKFLCPDEACDRLAVGPDFVLWEGRVIGDGKILESFL